MYVGETISVRLDYCNEVILLDVGCFGDQSMLFPTCISLN